MDVHPMQEEPEMVIFDEDGSRLELTDDGDLNTTHEGAHTSVGLNLEDLLRLSEAIAAAIRNQVDADRYR